MPQSRSVIVNESQQLNCPFCEPDPERVLHSDSLAKIINDGYPISPGHMLIIPCAHHATIFDAPPEHQAHIFGLINEAKEIIYRSFTPDGFNIGINSGKAAGQTIPHAHIHVIPRYIGDVKDPRGGVRWIIPTKARYWE